MMEPAAGRACSGGGVSVPELAGGLAVVRPFAEVCVELAVWGGVSAVNGASALVGSRLVWLAGGVGVARPVRDGPGAGGARAMSGVGAASVAAGIRSP
jgi:hypothetical protein